MLKITAVLAASILCLPTAALAQPPSMDRLLYGVAYYDEYMPHERLEQDVRMMTRGRHQRRPHRGVHVGHARAAGRHLRLHPCRPGARRHAPRLHPRDRRDAHLRRADVAGAQVPGCARRDAAGAEPVRTPAEHGHHQPALPHARRARDPAAGGARQGPPGRDRLPGGQRDEALPDGRPGRAGVVRALHEGHVQDARRGQRRLRPRLLEQPDQQLGRLPVDGRQHQREPERRVREVPAPAGDRLPGVAGGDRARATRGPASSSRRTSISSGGATRTASSRTSITSRRRRRWTSPASTSTTRRRTR